MKILLSLYANFIFNDLDFEKTRRTELCLQIQKVCFKNSPKIVTFGERDLLQVIFFYSLNFFSLEFHLCLFYLFWCLLFFCSYSWSYWRNFSCYFFCLVNLVTFLFVFLLKKNHRNFCFSIFSSKRKKEKKQWIFFHISSHDTKLQVVFWRFFFFVCSFVCLFGLF